MSQELKIYKCSQCGNEIKSENKPQNCISCNGINFFIDFDSHEKLSNSYNELTKRVERLEDFFRNKYGFLAEEKPSNLISNRQNYAVDWCFCVDATNSMTPFIEGVRKQIIEFPKRLEKQLNERNLNIISYRIRIIVFRDFNLCPTEKAIIISPFFSFPNEQYHFEKFIWNVEPEIETNNNNCSNGLEALALAIKSPWETNPLWRRKRQIIVLYTDKPAYPLENNSSQAFSYLSNIIPKTFDDLTDEWDELPYSKRLILFSPDLSPYTEINSWDCLIHFPSQAGEGLADFEIEEIIAALWDDV